MFKVSLINPPERIVGQGSNYWLPFPLLYLAADLEANGVRADIIDIKTEKTYFDVIKNIISEYYYALILKKQAILADTLYSCVKNKIIEETISSSPSLIGMSCITREYNSVMQIASILKKKLGVPIVAGGIHPSLYAEQFIYEKSPVDFAVIGEGEETLLELVRCLESGKKKYEDIDGIAYLKDGRCFWTKKRSLKDELLVSPINAYHKIDMKFYTRPHSSVTRFVRISGTQIFTSRGCPYRCTFCSNPLIWKMNKSYIPIRYRPIKDVVEEIKFLRDQYHIDGFFIMDDTFCIEKRRVEEFCSELKNAGIDLVWAAETRSNLVDAALLKKMKKAGLVQLDIGAESGSNEMLKEIQKGFKVEDTLNLFSLMRKYKIRSLINIMLNLPNETLEQLQETINLLKKVKATSAQISVTVPLPKTEIFDRYIAHKMDSDLEMGELIGRPSNFYKISDERFHLCKYNVDFEELINRLVFKHFRFSELKLGGWFWKMFFKSKRKLEYVFAIICGVINVIERVVFMPKYLFKKKAARIKYDKKDEIELLKI